MRLLNVFRSPSTWAKDCQCVNKDGKKCGLTGLYSEENDWYPKHISRFSLYGAVSYFIRESDARYKIMNNLRKAIYEVTGKNISVAAFNDASETTFEDLRKVLQLTYKR